VEAARQGDRQRADTPAKISPQVAIPLGEVRWESDIAPYATSMMSAEDTA